jgi:prevent-host-death family protein
MAEVISTPTSKKATRKILTGWSLCVRILCASECLVKLLVIKRKPMSWPVQEAKARFSELLDKSVSKGPQIVTKRGVETAVLVPIDEWRRLQQRARPTLKELLLAPEPRFEMEIPNRRRWRSPPELR